VLCGKKVTRLVLADGRCVGVETADGGQYRAGTAVVSTIHAVHLRDMAPRGAWPAEFHYGIDTYDVGVPGFATYYCTTAPPEFASPHGPRSAVSAGLAGWPDDFIQLGADLRAGRFLTDPAWMLVATPTLADEVILAHLTKSPADIEELNPHMIHGAFHGGNRGPAFSGPLRPAPGWASHRMPIPGLYQTGGSTHPGGSITGAPGRNAAIVLLTDLGHDPAAVMSAPAVPARAGTATAASGPSGG
jgi:phytoene dehydrogenase-like protein